MDWSKYLSPERVRDGKESAGGVDKRSPFESDYGRVLFSSAIRRMHDKTQVIPLDQLSYYAFHKDSKFRGRVKSAISRSRLEVSVHENSFPDEQSKFFTGTELYEYDIVKMGSYGRWRMIVDFVSSMTDKYAVTLYQQLSGNKI